MSAPHGGPARRALQQLVDHVERMARSAAPRKPATSGPHLHFDPEGTAVVHTVRRRPQSEPSWSIYAEPSLHRTRLRLTDAEINEVAHNSVRDLADHLGVGYRGMQRITLDDGTYASVMHVTHDRLPEVKPRLAEGPVLSLTQLCRRLGVGDLPYRFEARRDAAGTIRLTTGTHIANSSCSRADVQGWFDRSEPGRWREMYRAALALLDREEA